MTCDESYKRSQLTTAVAGFVNNFKQTFLILTIFIYSLNISHFLTACSLQFCRSTP